MRDECKIVTAIFALLTELPQTKLNTDIHLHSHRRVRQTKRTSAKDVANFVTQQREEGSGKVNKRNKGDGSEYNIMEPKEYHPTSLGKSCNDKNPSADTF